MSGYAFDVKRVPAGPCFIQGCTFAARNEVRMVFPKEAGPFRACGHHKHEAKDECRQPMGAKR